MIATVQKINLEVEILDHETIVDTKKYLKKNSNSFYEDFLLDYIVFIETDISFKKTLLQNNKLKIHQPNVAYQM